MRRTGASGGERERGPDETTPATSPPQTTMAVTASRTKLDQIVQNFFTKGANIVIQSRMNVSPILLRGSSTKKMNRWFNLELLESENFREDLRIWRNSDALDTAPGPLVVETYLDTLDVAPDQTLVLVSSDGTKRKVETASHHDKIVLEKWRIQVLPTVCNSPSDIPVAYKKTVVMFRSLFTLCRLLPVWKLRRRLSKAKLSSNLLKIRCRIRQDLEKPGMIEHGSALTLPLTRNDKAQLLTYTFANIETKAGKFSIQVSYRPNCDFRVDDAEALLSSHFASMDRRLLRPQSLQLTSSQQGRTSTGSADYIHQSGHPEGGHAYGSLGTYHDSTGATGSSPMTALRAVQYGSSSTSLKNNISPVRQTPTHSDGASSRRPSVSFIRPFKSPSLSTSPSSAEASSSLRSMQGTARRPSLLQNTVEASSNDMGSSESSKLDTNPVPPSRPTTVLRYNSSFNQRRTLSLSRQLNSEKGNMASSSLGSPKQEFGNYEDDDVDEFVKMLDNRKPLRGFLGPPPDAMTEGKNFLSKCQQLRDVHAALGESISSSLVLQRSPSTASSSSRHIQAVPSMMAENIGYSSSSSVGKPISPHTPAIPSRLSSGLTVNETRPSQTHRDDPSTSHESRERELMQISDARISTSPLDIPNSPRRRLGTSSSVSLNQVGERVRSGSMSQFVDRRPSTSLGSAENVQVNFQDLLERSEQARVARSGTSSYHESGCSASDKQLPLSSTRPRLPRGSSGSQTRPTVLSASTSSLVLHRSARRSSPSYYGPNRPSFSVGDDDELLFAMSDMVAQQGQHNTVPERDDG